MPGISDVRKYEGTGYAGYKAPAYVAPKANDQEEESGGSGGGGASPGWLQQAIQGPEWASESNRIASERRQQLRSIKTPGGGMPYPMEGRKVSIGIGGKAGGRPIMPMRVDPNTGAAEYAGGTIVDANGFELPQGSIPNEIPRMGAASSSYLNQVVSPGVTAASNDAGFLSQKNDVWGGMSGAQVQSPSWMFSNGGGAYDVNNPIPAWRPTDWVNPANPNPPVIPPVEPEPVMGGLTESNQPIGATIAAMNETRNPDTVLASYRMQHTTPGSPEYLDALAMYQASLPPTAGRPNSYSQGYLDKLNNPAAQTQPGVGMGDLRKLEATQGQAATGAIPPEEAAILQKYGIDPSTIKPTAQAGAGSGKDASGNVINPWEKVQDPGTGVIHPRGLSLEEVINPTAANLTTGFDYRNNPGYKGMTVTMPDGTVLPQIAGYYIQNGRYFPIDLNAVSKMMKRYGGYSGGGGGGGGGNYGSGQKGWLASWNIGV